MHLLLMYSSHAPSAGHLARLAALDPGGRVTVAADEATARAAMATADVVFGHRFLHQTLGASTRLRWVQSTAGGMDKLPEAGLAARGVVLTRATLASAAIARHAVTLAWAISRRLPECVRAQAEGARALMLDPLPAPRRALVLGAGAIGGEIARLLARDGVAVTGARRHVDSPVPEGFARVIGGDGWRDALALTDWCFLALPNTPATAALVGERELRALPAHAVVVNVGRGETLAHDDLARVLGGGHLGGAGLDVLAPRPAPGDAFWRTPRLLVTPHVAARWPERPAALERFCEAQLERFLAGRPLENVVPFVRPAAGGAVS